MEKEIARIKPLNTANRSQKNMNLQIALMLFTIAIILAIMAAVDGVGQ